MQKGEIVNIALLKAELFTQGVRFSTDDFKTLRRQNPFNENRSGLSAGRFVTLNGSVFVNIPFWEPFVAYSPFRFERGVLYKDDQPTDVRFDFAPSPSWLDQRLPSGSFAGQVIQPHGKANLATMLFGCQLQTPENRCRFCTAPFYKPGSERKAADLLSAVEVALTENQGYTLSINAGTLTSEGRGMEIVVPTVDVLRRQFPDLGIMVEIAPPKNLRWLENLRKANADGRLGIMFNLNFWSRAALEIVEPAKNKLIPKEEYFAVWEKALGIFGQNAISSCLLCGVEAERYTMQAVDYLTDVGVIPEIIAFRPTIGSELNRVPSDPDLLYRLSQYARRRMLEKGIRPAQIGCVNCGGCSLTAMKDEG
jgi:hypothetical protein